MIIKEDYNKIRKAQTGFIMPNFARIDNSNRKNEKI